MPDPVTSSSQLDEILSGGGARLQQAVGTAFDQFFSGTLSGRQQDAVTSVIKNRKARNLRGAAAEAAATKLQESFTASNRAAALGFISQAVASNRLPLQSRGFKRGGEEVGQFRGTGTAGQTGAFEAFAAELTGLGAIGQEEGGAALNRRVQQALEAAGGDRRKAFENLFQTSQLGAVQDVLNPTGAFNRLIAAQEGTIQQQVNELQQNLFQVRAGNRAGRLDENLTQLAQQGIVTNQFLRLDQSLLDRFGASEELVAGQGAGVALQTALGRQGKSLTGAVSELLGLEGQGLEASVVSGVAPNGKESALFIGLQGQTLRDQARLLLNLTGTARGDTAGGGVSRALSNRLASLQSALSTNLGELDQLVQARDATTSVGTEQIGLIEGQSRRLQQLQQGGDVRTETLQTFRNPYTGNRRVDTRTVRQAETARQSEIAGLQENLSLSQRLRTSLFSPEVPFFA